MRISDVLQSKGPNVTTLDAGATVRDLVEVLGERRIGAVIVSSSDRSLAGMVSERDVVRQLQLQADRLLDQPVASIMTADVVVCASRDSVDTVLQLMTERRIRHVPVVDDGEIVGIVSIGDLVKSRIDELRLERDQLTNYISGSA
ncbi:MAG TPA: CBS domain-containing protein [Frankiaceae bacterium]|nr:CBS domain-containing protein [Frankiaceae bacterium]